MTGNPRDLTLIVGRHDLTGFCGKAGTIERSVTQWLACVVAISAAIPDLPFRLRTHMFSNYWAHLTVEDKFVCIVLLVLIILWLTWTILSNTAFGDRRKVVEFEEQLWRQHGITIAGAILTLAIIIIILYFVWLVLGEL